MAEFRCYGFTGARFRAESVRLDPPLQLLAGWELVGVGYLPLVAHGRVVLAHTSGVIAAYEEATAAPLWRYSLLRSFAPVASADGACLLDSDRVLVFGGGDLHILDLASGALLDRRPAPGLRLHGGFVQNGRLVCHYWDGALFVGAYDLTRHSFAWSVPVPELVGSLTAADGVVCYLPSDDTIAALDLSSGHPRWIVNLGDLGRYHDLDGTDRPGTTRGVPLAMGGQLIVAIMGHHVLSLDLQTGDQRWVQQLETRNPYTLTGYADGRLYVLGDDYCEILHAADGALIGRLSVAAELGRHGLYAPFTYLSLSDAYLYCIAASGTLLAMDIATGAIPWTYRCNAPAAVGDAPLILDNRLYALDRRGKLYVFTRAAV